MRLRGREFDWPTAWAHGAPVQRWTSACDASRQSHKAKLCDSRVHSGMAAMGTEILADVLRPIFETEGFEDIDETCFQGAYVGGMAAAYEDAGIATSYMLAADVLVGQGLNDDCVHEVVLPILFLYRHALEVRIKFAIQPAKLNHDLGSLVRQLDALLVTKRGTGLVPGLVDRVDEIARVDPGADAFRFTNKSRRSSINRPHFAEEVWVDLAHLRDVMAWIDAELRAASES